jgi:hypothetical protein
MRKIVLSLAAAGAALAVASPAAAQYYPQPQPAPYGYGNGFHGNFGDARALQMRIDNIERQIRHMDRRDGIGDRRADRLLNEAQRLEQRLRWQARDGLNPWEAREVRARVDQLEQQVRQSFAYGYGRDDRRDREDRGDRWGDRDRD